MLLPLFNISVTMLSQWEQENKALRRNFLIWNLYYFHTNLVSTKVSFLQVLRYVSKLSEFVPYNSCRACYGRRGTPLRERAADRQCHWAGWHSVFLDNDRTLPALRVLVLVELLLIQTFTDWAMGRVIRAQRRSHAIVCELYRSSELLCLIYILLYSV